VVPGGLVATLGFGLLLAPPPFLGLCYLLRCLLEGELDLQTFYLRACLFVQLLNSFLCLTLILFI
jgi:hypothetical protein